MIFDKQSQRFSLKGFGKVIIILGKQVMMLGVMTGPDISNGNWEHFITAYRGYYSKALDGFFYVDMDFHEYYMANRESLNLGDPFTTGLIKNPVSVDIDSNLP